MNQLVGPPLDGFGGRAVIYVQERVGAFEQSRANADTCPLCIAPGRQ